MLEPKDVEHFMNQARIKLTGASDEGIKSERYEVLKEFFEDSNSWRSHLHLAVTAGLQRYTLIPRDNGQIIRLMGVWDGNRFPVAAFMPEFGELEVRWPIQVSTVIPAGQPPYQLQASNPWLVTVVENVQEPTTRENFPVAPAWALKVYSITILDGVLGKMMAQPFKSYSNDNKSAYHLRRFRTGIQMARTAAARQNTVGAQTWSFPRGWDGRTQRGNMSTAFPPATTW